MNNIMDITAVIEGVKALPEGMAERLHNTLLEGRSDFKPCSSQAVTASLKLSCVCSAHTSDANVHDRPSSL